MNKANKKSFQHSLRFLFFLSLLMVKFVAAQTSEEEVALQLSQTGFENVRVFNTESGIVCTIERGLNRSIKEDFKQSLSILKSIFPANKLKVYLLEHGQAIYELTTEEGENIESNTEEYNIKFANLKEYKNLKGRAIRPSNKEISLVFYPQLTLQNMSIEKLYEVQFNLAPALSYSAWAGMEVVGQLIIPLVNDFGFTGDYIRPGYLTFSQQIVLPGLNFVKFTVGNFNTNRYGGDLIWRKYFNGSPWRISARVSYTGRSMVYDGYWNHTPLNQISWNLNVGYYLPIYQIQADLQVGQFLAGDKGVQFDVYRHFGEVTIGFYANYSGYKPNGGFHFALPLDPFKRKHRHNIRLMLPSYFNMEYSAMNSFTYCRNFKTSPNENRSESDLYPQLIGYQLNFNKK